MFDKGKTICKRESIKICWMYNMKQFLSEVNEFGFKVAFSNLLLIITMDVVGVKNFKVSYKK